MTLYEDLQWRGLIKDVSSPELEKKLNEGGLTFYIEQTLQQTVCMLDIYLVFLFLKD